MINFWKTPSVTGLADDDLQLSDREIETLVHDIHQLYGYDFTNYSRSSFTRRVNRLFNADHFLNFADFRARLKTDSNYFTRFLSQITINVTEMFRDAGFYRTLRDEVLPALSNLKEIRIWHAGCSTGEEVYSMAILLHEAALLTKSRLFATDINPAVLSNAGRGMFPLACMGQYESNYKQAGGQADFKSYYKVGGSNAYFNTALGLKTTVSTYDLADCTPFDEFDIIFCRNVLIYFEKPLQLQILGLLSESTSAEGFLALGSKETLNYTNIEREFTQLGEEKIWRKTRRAE